MSIKKRLRGRPKGSGKNDLPTLEEVADLIVAEPSLRPTTAMKRVKASRRNWGATDETLLRRWQIKWKQDGETLLVMARERARPATNVSNNSSLPSFAGRPDWLGQLETLANSPQMRAMAAYANSPAMKAMEAFANSPTRKELETYANSPTMKAVIAIGEQQRKIWDLVDPPFMREIRRIAELRRKLHSFRF